MSLAAWNAPPPNRRAIAARNATTHGLFARDVVLTSLGEDPAGYNEVYLDLCMQINPTNLLERHYVEKIAAASWRLRRLHRWQAQMFEDVRLSEDERLTKIDKVMRHETALHRQIDTAIKMLSKHVPRLLATRAREEALAEMEQTDRACRDDSDIAAEVETKTRENLHFRPWPSDFEMKKLDNLVPVPEPEPHVTVPEDEEDEDDDDGLTDEEYAAVCLRESEELDRECEEARAVTKMEMDRGYAHHKHINNNPKAKV